MGRHSCDDTADGVSRYGTVFADAGERPQEISYDKFLKMVDEKKVEKVTIDSAKIYITLTDEARKEAIKKTRKKIQQLQSFLSRLKKRRREERENLTIIQAR